MLRASAWLILLSLAVPGATAGCSRAGETPPVNGQEVPDESQDMAVVPAGSFLFGATNNQVDFYIYQSTFNFPGMVEVIREQFVQPQRTETLNAFQIDRFEVTNSSFKRFLDATNYEPSSGKNFLNHWQGRTYPEWAADFPVVWVSFEDAEAYCDWRGGAVPTETEWEKAARGSDGRYFPWGNELAGKEVANFATDSPEPAGNRPGDVSPFGVFDLGANVSELTRSLVPGQGEVVIRGGSYKGSARDMLTCWRDLSAARSTRQEHVGFRCVAR